MKKLLIGISIIAVLMTFGFTQTITVTHPGAGDTITKGSPYTIRWTTSGAVFRNVKIRVYNSTATTKLLDIIDSVATSSLSYTCGENVFNSLDPGCYVVRVKTTNNATTGDSRVFTLVNPGEEPSESGMKSIRVVTPNGGKLALGSSIRLIWRSENLTNNVTISLLKNDMVFGTIVSGLAPGRITHDWRIGKTISRMATPDTGYKIRIDEDGASGVFDVSDNPFEIEPERNIDLSCYISSVNSLMITRKVRITVKVKCKNFPGAITNVPVKITLIKKSDGTICSTTTKTIPEVSYRGHSYEYSVNAQLSFIGCGISMITKRKNMEVIAVVDPDDIFRDRSRLDNTAKKDVTH